MLSLPLPPLADNISLFYVKRFDLDNTTEKQDSALQLIIYLTNLKTVGDLINLVISRYLKDKTRKVEEFYLLAANGRDFTVQK